MIVLVVDSQVKYFDLKQHFLANPRYIAEPTPERIWYKEKD